MGTKAFQAFQGRTGKLLPGSLDRSSSPGARIADFFPSQTNDGQTQGGFPGARPTNVESRPGGGKSGVKSHYQTEHRSPPGSPGPPRSSSSSSSRNAEIKPCKSFKTDFVPHKSDQKYCSIQAKVFSLESSPSKEAHLKVISTEELSKPGEMILEQSV